MRQKIEKNSKLLEGAIKVNVCPFLPYGHIHHGAKETDSNFNLFAAKKKKKVLSKKSDKSNRTSFLPFETRR